MTHAHVVAESVALVRSRLGVAAVLALVDDVLPHLVRDFANGRVAHIGGVRASGGA